MKKQHQVRCGEQLHGDVHGHVLDLVNQQCHCNEEERHDQAGERQRVGLRQEDEHQDAGDNSAGDVNQQELRIAWLEVRRAFEDSS